MAALKVKSLLLPGRYGDGGGLVLQVRSQHARSWLFRYTLLGRAHWMGLGDADLVSLAEARTKALECRKDLLDGMDPLERRRKIQKVAKAVKQVRTFKAVAEMYIVAQKAGWSNSKHANQWTSTLAAYAYPEFGDKPVHDIGTEEILAALVPIWSIKSETASRLRGRIEAVLGYAAARHWRPEFNPAGWAHLKSLLPAKARLTKVEHHAALPYADIPLFMVTLLQIEGASAAALAFAILTAARTSEVIGATWEEIDLDAATWIVPATRMKARREHRVPLSPEAVDALKKFSSAGQRAANNFVFPGGRPGCGLSNMAMTMLVRGSSWPDITVHGFRSTFRDWVADQTNTANEIAEQALAHTLSNAVERAYRRGDLFEKRVQLMAAWGTYCAGGTTAAVPAQPAS